MTRDTHGVTVLLAVAIVGACERNDMQAQPRMEPYEPSAFFADGTSARPPVPGTVARGSLVEITPTTSPGASTSPSARPSACVCSALCVVQRAATPTPSGYSPSSVTKET